MTTAADLRADARYVLTQEGVGLSITLTMPGTGAGADTYNPATGTVTAAGGGQGPSNPVVKTGIGRVTRFSDALASGGLIQNNDRKIVWYPDDPTTEPVIDGFMIATNADGSTETYTVIAFNARTLGGEVIHYIVQGRR